MAMKILRKAVLAGTVLGIILFVPIRYFNLDVSNYYLAGFILVDVSLFLLKESKKIESVLVLR